VCPRIDPLRVLARCRRMRLKQGLDVPLDISVSVRYGMFSCYLFLVSGCMLCLVRYLFVISISVIDCLGRFVSEMTRCMLNLPK